jgi:hypothetical protein
MNFILMILEVQVSWHLLGGKPSMAKDFQQPSITRAGGNAFRWINKLKFLLFSSMLSDYVLP